jgi:protein TonB
MVPTMIPETVPEIDPPGGSPDVPPGEGVEGGIEGGILGGVIGGVIGGEIGGILGGTEGGVLPPDPSGYFRAEYDVAKLSYTSQVFPVYPEDARIRGLEGIVIVDYVVDKNGKVREVRVLQDPHPMLTKAAVGAIKQWRVKPTIVNGEPVEVIHKLSIIFSLQ